MPTGHAITIEQVYEDPVEVPGEGTHDTPSEAMNVQIADYLHLIVITKGEGAGDTDDIVLKIEGQGKSGIWNTGNPIPLYIPVHGDTDSTDAPFGVASSEIIDVRGYQQVRIGSIGNPNSGDVTVQVLGDAKA